jgi:hypothetical protein
LFVKAQSEVRPSVPLIDPDKTHFLPEIVLTTYQVKIEPDRPNDPADTWPSS